MFCTNCGASLPDGAKFCTSCGAQLDGAQPASDPQPASKGRRRRGPVVVIVCALVVLLAAAALLVTRLLGLWGVEPPTVSFGSREQVAVSRVTRIVPRDASGAPLAHYVVRLREGTAPDGSAIDVSGLPHLDVTGTDEGFSMADFGELATGTYEVTVTADDQAPQFIPPVSVVDEAPDAGSEDAPPEKVIVAPAAGAATDGGEATASARRGRYAAYLSVVRDIEAKSAKPTLVSTPESASYRQFWAYGLSYADLVDFGDGKERLVVAYSADPAVAERYPGSADSYNVEVWGYDEASDAATMLWQGHHSYSNGGYAYVNYGAVLEDGRRFLVGAFSDAGYDFVGIADDGSFGLVHSIVIGAGVSDGGNFTGYTYTVDGQVVDQDTYFAKLAEFGLGLAQGDVDDLSYCLAADANYQEDVEATLDVASGTTGMLEQLAGDLLDL